MTALTINQLIAEIRQNADAVGSERWTDDEIVAALNYVYDAEWSRLLQASPYYRFSRITVQTDDAGTFPLSSLNTGSGNAKKNFYRILSINDGNLEYTETRFQDIPLATTSAYLPYLRKMYYLAGESYQILPAGALSLYVVVNYKPTAIREYVNSGTTDKWDIPVDYPENNEQVLVYETVSRLLVKGGTETKAAADFAGLAERERADLLDDLARRTINPRRLGYPDRAADWNG